MGIAGVVRGQDGLSLFRLFWIIYYWLGKAKSFNEDYLEAWKQVFEEEDASMKASNSSSIMLFRDNFGPFEVPCSKRMMDEDFVRHIRSFYYILRTQGGLLEALSFRELNFIEVVTVRTRAENDCKTFTNFIKLERNMAVGYRKYYLDLGRYRYDNRLVHFFRHPSQLKYSSSIVKRLKEDKIICIPSMNPLLVMSPDSTTADVMVRLHTSRSANAITTLAGAEESPGMTIPSTRPMISEHGGALNLVSRWNTSTAGTIVALPVVFSVFVCVAWPIVAHKVYGADVQSSVQTGFGVGSYIVTTGAIMIALVTFLDATNDKIQADHIGQSGKTTNTTGTTAVDSKDKTATNAVPNINARPATVGSTAAQTNTHSHKKEEPGKEDTEHKNGINVVENMV
jgi:hypothetical protein